MLARQAIKALIDKLGTAKAAEFWVSMGYGAGDYTKERRRLFKGKSVKELTREIGNRD